MIKIIKKENVIVITRKFLSLSSKIETASFSIVYIKHIDSKQDNEFKPWYLSFNVWKLCDRYLNWIKQNSQNFTCKIHKCIILNNDDAIISFICPLKHNQNKNKEMIKKKRSTSQKSY